MRLFRLYNLCYLLGLSSYRSTLAKRPFSFKQTNKICNDCKHFIADEKTCGKFFEIDLVSGKKTYEPARIIRKNTEQCGETATSFEPNHFKVITAPYYFLKENIIFIILLGPTILLYGFANVYYLFDK